MRHTKKTIEYDGKKFDSKPEMQYYKTLVERQERGEISEIECQPKFLLQDGFRYKGKWYPKIVYIADFRIIYPDGREEIIDVKSKYTRKDGLYRLKMKMLLCKYDVDFREVIIERGKIIC